MTDIDKLAGILTESLVVGRSEGRWVLMTVDPMEIICMASTWDEFMELVSEYCSEGEDQ